MSETPPPPPAGGDPNQPPPTTPYQQQPPQGWQAGYGQPGYGQQGPQVPYGMPQYSPMYAPIARDHPQATTVLILGILGLVLCQILSPFAWVMGNRVVREIDASGGTIGGRSNANAGRICGIVGTVLIGVGLLFAVVVIIVALAGASTS